MDRRDLESRIQAAFDGELDEAGVQGLRREMLASDKALDLYCDYAVMESAMRGYAQQNRDLLKFPERPGLKRYFWNPVVLTAAAVLIVGMFLGVMVQRERATTMRARVFTSSPGSVLRSASGGEVNAGNVWEGERVAIEQGVVKLELENGVSAIIEGPAAFRVASKDRVDLESGHSWFHVPEKARGFKAVAQELEVVDLGTEFGMDLRENEPPSVQVMEGKVEAHARRGNREVRTLVKGDVATLAKEGSWKISAAGSDSFRRDLPSSLPYLAMNFDTLEGDRLKIDGNILEGAQSTAYLRYSEGAQLVPGIKGQALELDGTSAYVETTWRGVAGSGPRTVSLWCRLEKGQRMETAPPFALWGNPAIGANAKFKFGVVTNREGKTTLRGSFGEWLTNGTTDLADGEWHHLAMVYNGNRSDGVPRLTFYVDGKPEAQEPQKISQAEIRTDVESKRSLSLTMGRYELPTGANPYFRGTIDEFRVVAGALTPEEIAVEAKR